MRIRKAVLLAGTAFVLVLPFKAAMCAGDQDLVDAMFSRPVATEVLEAQRGKAVLTVMDLDGVVADNHASHLTTGQNVISTGSFTNASGLTTTIQNSGNNVLIQNATILQLDVR